MRQLRNLRRKAITAIDTLRSEYINLYGPPLSDEDAVQIQPIFFLSTGRCGTKWLTYILDRSSQVITMHEPIPRLFIQSRKYYQEKNPDANCYAQIVRGARDDYLATALRSNKTYIETNNRLTFLAAPLKTAYPKSRFVHIHRDPASFVKSAMRRNYYAGNLWDSSRIIMHDQATWERMDAFERCCWLWNETNQVIIDFLKTLPHQESFTLSSNEMWSDSSKLAGLLKFLDVTEIKDAEIKKLQKNHINKQKYGTYDDYNDWSLEQKRTLARFCPLAQELGYEL